MNAERRKQLEKAGELIAEAKELIEVSRDAEQEAYDNLPEGIQAGERGEKMDAAVSVLDDVAGDLEDCIERLHEAVE